ncbi:MAG: DUF3606 domain-containing protein [Betaproteobacteria bacterium]|nr:DUF3606 domain-containing protein [Betaproteobacteria bacterium]
MTAPILTFGANCEHSGSALKRALLANYRRLVNHSWARSEKNRGAQDRSRVNTSQDYEVRYSTQEFGVTEEQLRDAVQRVGSSADKVREHLRQGRPVVQASYIRPKGFATTCPTYGLASTLALAGPCGYVSKPRVKRTTEVLIGLRRHSRRTVLPRRILCAEFSFPCFSSPAACNCRRLRRTCRRRDSRRCPANR